VRAHGPYGRNRAHVALAAGLLALSAFVFWQLEAIPADGGYSAVGPRFTPMLIAIGLAVVGVVLLVQALAGGWRGLEGTAPPEPFFAPAFGWITAGLVLHMAVIGFAGFTLASTMLFTLVARGFGSRRIVRDALIGFVLAACIFLFFTRVLSLQLPAGPLRIL
jgi:putative tricarboxylic transport membrane protein